MTERVRLAEELWNDILENGFEPSLTAEEIAELDRRAEEAIAHPERSVPLEKAFENVQRSLRNR